MTPQRKPQAPPLRDQYGRSISYLRLSVTDRCNLRCLYCAPGSDAAPTNAPGFNAQGSGASASDPWPDIGHDRVLRYEEFLRLARIAADFGVLKIRLTGGEPFVRKGFMDFVRALREELPHIFLGITTNATLLYPHLRALKELRLDSLNISLDTFKADKYAKITGADLLPEVLKAIHGAIDEGLRVKINAVGLKDLNRDELADFIAFARNHPVDFRVIEHMPLGGRYDWKDANFWPAEQILREAGALAELAPERVGEEQILYLPEQGPVKAGLSGPAPSGAESGQAGRPGPEETAQAADCACAGPRFSINGPARMYEIAGGAGRFGVISPVSDHFCLGCNRLRVTAEGRLRPCLFSDAEYPLAGLLRDGSTDQDLYRVFEAANRNKPMGSDLLRQREKRGAVIQKIMSSIGG